MTGHLHDEYVPGCRRCELDLDEDIEASLGQANAEVCRCSHVAFVHTDRTGQCWGRVCGCMQMRPREEAK